MSDFENLDHYQLLGVSRAATPEEIKRAYRQEISKYHPDRFANATPVEQEYASQRSQRITEAYSVLSDMATRAAYNRGQSAPAGRVRRTPPPAQTRDHQAELYEQARQHLAADRPLQAIGALRQLQKMNPFYRDSADLLAHAEAQLQARQRRVGVRSARRPLFIVGGLAGGLAVVALIALAVGLSRSAGTTIGAASGATAPAALITSAPTEPPVPTITPGLPTAAPTAPAPTAAPPTEAAPTAPPTVPATDTPVPASTAPAEPTPTPAGETGVLALADTFSSGGWTNSSATGWRVGYQGGRYRVAVDAGYGTIWSYRTAPLSDYSLGVDVQVARGEGGLLLRFVDARNYLSFSVNPAQTSYRLEQHRGGNVIVLAGGQSEAIQAGSEASNRLVARLEGEHVELLINRQPLATLDAPGASSSSLFGLLAIGGADDSEALFDNLQIRQLDN